MVRLIERSSSPRLTEADDLVEAGLRGTEFGVGLVEREQFVLVGGQPEEVALLGRPRDLGVGFTGVPDAVVLDYGLVLDVKRLVRTEYQPSYLDR